MAKKEKIRSTGRLTIRSALQSLSAVEGNLYEAVAQYIEKGGGHPIVIGGIEVQQWPNDPKGKYRVAVSFLGKPPEYANPQ